MNKTRKFTQQEIIEILRMRKGEDSLDSYAKKLKIHRQKLWNILSGKQLPDESVGFKLIEKRHFFEMLEEGK